MSKEQHKVLDFTLELPWEQFHFPSYFSDMTKLEALDSTLSACSTTVPNGLGHSSSMTEDAVKVTDLLPHEGDKVQEANEQGTAQGS